MNVMKNWEPLVFGPELAMERTPRPSCFILFEIFAGEAGKIAETGVSENVQTSFATMRFIVSVGWSIYPLGYFFGYFMGGVADCTLNLVYNLADFVNKIAFCLAIWASAKKDTREREGKSESLLP